MENRKYEYSNSTYGAVRENSYDHSIQAPKYGVNQGAKVEEIGRYREQTASKKLIKTNSAALRPFILVFAAATIMLILVVQAAMFYTISRTIRDNNQLIDWTMKETEGIKVEILKKKSIDSVVQRVDPKVYVDINPSKAIYADLSFNNFSEVKKVEPKLSFLDKIRIFFYGGN